MIDIEKSLRNTNITVSLQKKNNIYHAIINYKDDNNKRKQKWISTGIKVARGNKRLALRKAEKYREKFEKLFLSKMQMLQDQNEQAQKYLFFRERLNTIFPNNKNYDEDILFIDYLKLWIKKAKANLEFTTYSVHLQMINSRINSYFSSHPIKLLELNHTHIQSFYEFLLSENLKSSTIIRYHAIIRKSLDYAFKQDLIATNPADKVNCPRKNVFVGSFYSVDELNTLFEKSKDDVLHLVILLTAFYGLRRSEVLGLKWSAIDFENKTITIKHTVVEINLNGKKKILSKDRTKTNSSYRILPLTEEVMNALYEVKSRQEKNKNFRTFYTNKYKDYICLDKKGKLLEPDYVTSHFRLLLVKNDLRRIRFHDLRHSCASLLLSRNIPMKAIQEWLGHANFSTTANIYAHLDMKAKILSAEAISSAFSSAK